MWAAIAGAVLSAASAAYGAHENNKNQNKADRQNQANAEVARQNANNYQHSANNFALAQYQPYMDGGLNAWNAMQQGMGGDGSYNNYNPNTRPTHYGLNQSLSGVPGGYIPGYNNPLNNEVHQDAINYLSNHGQTAQKINTPDQDNQEQESNTLGAVNRPGFGFGESSNAMGVDNHLGRRKVIYDGDLERMYGQNRFSQ